MIMLSHNAMTTLEDVKIVKNISQDDTSYDDFITLLINYASDWIESMTSRKFGLKRYKEKITGEGLQEIVARHYPIREIHSITEAGVHIDPDSYSINESGHLGIIYKDTGWGKSGYPIGLVPDSVLSKRQVAVEYTAGYVLPKDMDDTNPREWLLPYDLQGLVWQIVSTELELSENASDGLSAFSISDVSWTFDKTPRQSWLDTINAYKEVR